MKNVLIIEDDTHIQDIFRIIFSSYGYNVTCAESGEKIDILTQTRPDVIILDKQLPGMSGIDICKGLKATHRTSAIPVIMISALTGIEELAMNAGADDFIEKPFNMHVILKKVSTLLGNAQKRSVL